MRRTLVSIAATASIVVAACSTGSSPSPAASGALPSGTAATGSSASAAATESAAVSESASAGASVGASESASASAGTSAEASPSASSSGGVAGATSSPSASSGASAAPVGSFEAGISGNAVLSGWQASPDEGQALTNALIGFSTTYPQVHVNYQPIAGDYPTVMVTKFSSGQPPDLFYVNADYAQEWIDQGFLAPLDDYVSQSGFDTSKFFPGAASIFKGKDGKTYGFPKDTNTIGMAYRTDLVTDPPKTLDDLMKTAESLKGKSGLKAPMCLNPGLDRGLAFLYAQGGSIVSDDGQTDQIDTDASKSAVQWYMDLFKNDLGMTPSALGSSWCGEALGKKQVAMVFEGGWLDPAMTSTYPDVKYDWAPFPTGSSGSPVTISFTASYSIGADSANKDQAWVLLQYLTGVAGMTSWTEGGVALPSRSDVPIPKGKDVLANQSSYAKPGSGFMPGWTDVQKAFQDAFTAQVQNKSYDAGPVVSATKTAVDKAIK